MNIKELIEKYELELKDVQLKFGANYKTKVYEGVLDDLKQLDEPQKPVVPQFAADWIDYCKEKHLTITGAFYPVSEHGIGLAETFKGNAYKCTRWALDNQNLFARAWLDGYTVEKEKRYYVRLKGVDENYNYFNCIKHLNAWCLTELKTDKKFRMTHTRKELEDAGFGEVFNSPLFEIEEVEG